MTDGNGLVVEELTDKRNLVCLNDGNYTRVNVATGKESVLDLTVVSDLIAGSTEWEIMGQDTIGSDHYPIMSTVRVQGRRNVISKGGKGNWKYDKASWDEFMKLSQEGLQNIVMESEQWRVFVKE